MHLVIKLAVVGMGPLPTVQLVTCKGLKIMLLVCHGTILVTESNKDVATCCTAEDLWSLLIQSKQQQYHLIM